MHTNSKRFLLAGVAAVVVAGLVWAGAVAGSVGGKEQMEAALWRELGVPVKIGSLHFSLWSGFRANGVTLEIPAASEECAPSSLSIPMITAKVAFWPLFSGRVVIRQLSLRDPSVVWVQAAEGQWALCLKRKTAKSERPGAPGIAETPSSAEAAATPKPAKSPKEAKAPRGEKEHKSPEFQIQSVRVKNALFRFVDHQGRTSALVEGGAVACRMKDPWSAEGKLSVSRVTLRDGASLEELEAPFRLENDLLAFPAIQARLAEGNVRGSGSVHVETNAPQFTSGSEPFPPAFTLDVQFDGVSLNHLLLDTGKVSRATSGILHGNLDVYAMALDTKSIRGVGHLQMSNGRMEQFPLLQMIGKAVPIEELKDLELRQAQLDLRADDGKIHVDSLVMESPNLRLTARGTSGWDGKLALAARLNVNAKVHRQLPGWVAANFRPDASAGERREIDFSIGGTLSRPNTDLMQMMVGRKVGDQLMNLWKSLTGKPKKGEDGKKKADGAPAAEEKESGDPPDGGGN